MNEQARTARRWPSGSGRRVWNELGRRVDSRRPERRLSQVLLGIATGTLVLAMASIAVLAVTYQARLERDAARSPLPVADGTAGAGRFIPISDSVGTRWVDVFVIEPGPNTALPPGLSAWPEPGHVVLSPALDGTEDGATIVARYGTASPGMIGLDGLTSPAERLAYVRPAAGTVQKDRGWAVTGYGFPDHPMLLDDGQWGGALRQPPFEIAAGTVLVFLVIPALVLMFVAARAGSGRRDRQQQLLSMLGADRQTRRDYLAGSTGRPMIIGAAGAAVLLLVLMVTDVQLPVVDYPLLSADMRRGSLWIVLTALLGVGTAMAIVRRTNKVRPSLSATRPQPARLVERRWKILLLPAVCFLFVTGFTWSLSYTDTYARTLMIYLGIAAIAGTLPSFIGALSALAARLMVVLGVRRGSPGLIVAGRRVLAEPRALRRLTAGVALVVVLSAHVMVLGTVTNPEEQSARRLDQLVHGSMVTADWPRSTKEQSALIEALGRGTLYVGLIVRDPTNHPGQVELQATCPALTSLGLDCADTTFAPSSLPGTARISFLRSLTYITTLDVRLRDPLAVTEPEDSSAEYDLYAMTPDGTAFPLERVRTDLDHSVLPAPAVTDVAASWSVGTQQQIDLFAWLPLFSGCAALMLVTAILGALLGDANVQADQVGVARMWSPGAELSVTIAIGTVLVPVLIAVVVAAGVAFWTTYPLTIAPINGELPRAYWIVTVVLPLLMAVLITSAGAMLHRRRIEGWMPAKQ